MAACDECMSEKTELFRRGYHFLCWDCKEEAEKREAENLNEGEGIDGA